MDLSFNKEDIQNYITNNINSFHPIVRALNYGNLVIFVGAGMSVHLGVPDWGDFALKYLDLIYENKNLTLMNYKTKESLKTEDTRIILSLCKFVASSKMTISELRKAYNCWFKVDLARVREMGLYDKLYNLNAIYITTNYDNALDLLAEQPITKDLSTEIEVTDIENNKLVTR
ncbi:MAG: SIR2 family protein, partial [Bacillota bacterium]